MRTYTEEEIKEMRMKMNQYDIFLNRWLSKFHNLTAEERLELVKKIDAKYKSDEYKNRFIGYEPPNTLLDYIFDYGFIYGEEIEYMQDGYFPEEQYKIDDSFVVGRVYGQGDFTYIAFLDADLEKRQLRIDFFKAWQKFAKEWTERLDGEYSITGTINIRSYQHQTKGGLQKFTIDGSRFDITEPEKSRD